MATILVVDDEVGIRELLSEILADEGFTVRLAENAQAARDWRNRERPDLVLLDIWMPDTDGVSLLKEWSATGQLTMPVVMMSGHASIDSAVEATKVGALDFLEKPIALQRLLATVRRALAATSERREQHLTLASLGRSGVIADLRRRLQQLATTRTAVLLRGEPGSLAEACARTLQPSGSAFVNATLQLADISDEWIAGYAGGITFVEDLLELSRPQLKGLTFLVSRAERHGVRLVSFSSAEPSRLAGLGAMDPGILAKLQEVIVPLPPLRAHAEDIPVIAPAILAQMVEARVVPTKRLSTAALNTLRNFSWPRNFEQLRQVLRSVALGAVDEEIHAAEVERVLEAVSAASRHLGSVNFDQPLREARDQFERAYFEYLIEKEGNSMSRVAERSGMERTHLYRKLKALGIQPSRAKE
jgi:two-component system, NtrC family, nitrogen regulation response regulator NtrX